MISGDPGDALALCPLLTSLRVLSTCVAWQIVPLRYGRKGGGRADRLRVSIFTGGVGFYSSLLFVLQSWLAFLNFDLGCEN